MPFAYTGGFGGPGPTAGPDIFTPAGTPAGRVTISHRNGPGRLGAVKRP